MQQRVESDAATARTEQQGRSDADRKIRFYSKAFLALALAFFLFKAYALLAPIYLR
ncbi:MAG: hypothetical protein ACFCUN_08190 [Hyphomicrobiaceae bacterium]